MKKTITLAPDYSKQSFFNDGNFLFCNALPKQLEFIDFGTFQMKYQNKQIPVSVSISEQAIKIDDEKGEKYIQIENVCFKKILHPKTQQLGFRLSKNGQYAEFFGEIVELWKSIKKYVVQADFLLKYKLGSKIGEGYSSSVFKAFKIINGQRFAVKIVDKNMLSRSNNLEKQYLLNELSILRQINHNNLLKLEEIFESEENIYIVTELLEGGALKNSIFKFRFSEEETIILMQSLFRTLHYLHQMNIFHHDIKFDNILLRDQQDLTSVCIINFGKAEILKSNISSSRNLNHHDTNSLISFFRKKDIYAISIIILSIFAKKLYQESQLLDELLMKNYQNVSYIEFMNLLPPLQQFFEILFTEKGRYLIDTLTCNDILNLDVFKLNFQRRTSKFNQGLHVQAFDLKRQSRFLPRPSQKDNLQLSYLQKSLKLPNINDSCEIKATQNQSYSPQTENCLSNRLINECKINNQTPRYSILRKFLSPNV
ncbi:unnamed protein product [Paramecium pentaurelia]|uniref:Protein kinase domain-containing protein n=1 Tax=Paramecium pentaurelia TaxID=43138 RepID=A0A8S1T0D1_9CILI|nr:unnamed protein product [Paramecium pentaurelia]